MRYIARWNGEAWSAMGSGVNAEVYLLAAGPDGEVIARGDITLAGGHVTAFFARWGVPDTCCPADFDRNGVRDVSDIFAFLSGWFALDPRADFDSDGTVSVSDIFVFLSAWFEGC